MKTQPVRNLMQLTYQANEAEKKGDFDKAIYLLKEISKTITKKLLSYIEIPYDEKEKAIYNGLQNQLLATREKIKELRYVKLSFRNNGTNI